ncbi:MAG TPA: LPS assembly lipoprotein LptE [Gammaproteobacteria bacterium]|nr:LPS assembly lipoprotein LptE [Gammaproteobacteria bacterium]
MTKIHIILILLPALLLSACGFHLQGKMQLASPLHRLYLQTNDPYGHLAINLRQYLKASTVRLVSLPSEANTILTILRDESSQELLSVSGTQQTRQYNLRVTVVFEISATNGLTMVSPQTLSETRTITVQSNQILGSSNEANLFYQQIRRTLALAIMTRLASKEVTQQINQSFYRQHYREQK